jgi:CRP-like cAMP-binding protein
MTELEKVIKLFEKKNKSLEDLKELDQILLRTKSETSIVKLSESSRFQILSNIEVKHYNDKEIVFNKGDVSDSLYIIITGSLQMFYINSFGEKVLEKIISSGFVGERGIIKNKYRSLSVHAIGETYLAKIDAVTFKKHLLSEFSSSSMIKRSIIEKYLPGICYFTDTQKEKLIYAIDIKNYNKGNLLIRQSQLSEFMMIIIEGECVMVHDQGHSKKIVSILNTGSIIGEESAFLSRRSSYNVIVNSDYLKAAIIKISEAKNLFPASAVDLITNLFTQKLNVRNKLVSFSNPCIIKKNFLSFRRFGKSLVSSTKTDFGYARNKVVLKTLSFANILNK